MPWVPLIENLKNIHVLTVNQRRFIVNIREASFLYKKNEKKLLIFRILFNNINSCYYLIYVKLSLEIIEKF